MIPTKIRYSILNKKSKFESNLLKKKKINDSLEH